MDTNAFKWRVFGLKHPIEPGDLEEEEGDSIIYCFRLFVGQVKSG